MCLSTYPELGYGLHRVKLAGLSFTSPALLSEHLAGLPGGRPLVKDQESEPRQRHRALTCGAREHLIRAALRLTAAGRSLISPHNVDMGRSPDSVRVWHGAGRCGQNCGHEITNRALRDDQGGAIRCDDAADWAPLAVIFRASPGPDVRGDPAGTALGAGVLGRHARPWAEA
jgi:hypothetical protein